MGKKKKKRCRGFLLRQKGGPILPKVAAEMVEKGPISQDWPSGNDESRVLKRQENTISVVVPRFPFQKRIL